MAQIRVDDNTRDVLRGLKNGSETYDDVITRLIDENDAMKLMGGEINNE
jgi:predicted CopG family antitoxin